ncbi:hypothetical protein [Amycolatopsis sp. SID8362]|uniref:hypothetical protein n=1 Tax=Amycolatopsis sp. SID8362 TaxID=2690346 RepID=UPI00136850E9|nr:hypothetical protein [Amycolatopsis sp. SID8362]NBH04181.1 hypothetical protein [Amycolatopsis sp. SID8362]NED40880.1 hypothetical protein [Amycolatopsis sp. SID8362]
MSGEFGSGAADKAKTPKPPEKPAVPPDAQKPQHDTAHPANRPAQPDGKDNHAPTGPPGGKPPDLGHQGDTGAKPPDTHRSGDGPVKINEVPGPRNTDPPHRGGDQPPGPVLSTNMAQWRAQAEAGRVAPHPETAMVPATEIQHRVELPPIRFTHTLDLNQKFRDEHGKLDWVKVRAELNHVVKTYVGMAQHEHRRPGSPPHGGYGSRELRVQPVDLKVHLVDTKSDSEIVQVRAALREVCKTATKWDVRTHVDGPPPPRPDPPGPKTQPEFRPGPRTPGPGPEHRQERREHVEIPRLGQLPRQVPPVRQMPHVQRHVPPR